MNIQRCHILGFGRLNGLRLDFSDSLNVVFAPNEAGKSTLQRFLIAVLYGQLRPELKAQRRLDPWVDAYKPWNNMEYGGTLWCRLLNGREIEIRRIFGKEDGQVEIRAGTGEDITREYEQLRNGDVLFASFHFGLPKELFESLAVIRENKAAEINGYDTIRDRIANLAQSGDEDLSVKKSLQEIEVALETVGSERAPTKPYRQVLDRLQVLREEMKALDARRKDYEGWLAERDRWGNDVLRLAGELRTAQSVVAIARRREASEKVRVLEELESEINVLRKEIVGSEGDLEFPVHLLEDLNGLVGARESIGKRLAEARKELDTALKQLRSAEVEREALAHYERLISSGEVDKITGWFVGYLRLSTLRDEAQRVASRCQEEIRFGMEQLGSLGPAFSDPLVDWQARAMEASELERKGSAESLRLADDIAEHRTILADVQAHTARSRLLGSIALALLLVPLGGWFVLGSERVSPLTAIILSALLCLVSVLFLRSASRSTVQESQVAHSIWILESNQSRMQEESQRLQREIERAMRGSGYTTIEEFLAAARRAEQWRQKMADLMGRVRESEQQRDELSVECDEHYSRLQDLLARAGLSCSPGTVKTQVDVFRENLKKYRELDDAYRSSVQQVENLTNHEAELSGEAEERYRRIRAILDLAGVESPEAFRDACEKCRRLLELREKEASRVREFQRLCGNIPLEQWQARLRELERLKKDVPEVNQPWPPDNTRSGIAAPRLPFVPTLAEAEFEEKRIASHLAAAREEHARLVERVKQAFHNYRERSEIEEDLAQAENNHAALDRNRKSLEIALQTIESISREQQEVLAPRLNREVAHRFLRLCQGRYREVKIDLDFNVWVREVEAGELRNAANLSRGTQDQLYLALRFAILDLVAGAEEPCPCLLDEPFAAYDRERMFEAYRILEKEAAQRQLILFTCREDLRDMAQIRGTHILQLTAPRPAPDMHLKA